ncbi:hypothetical protein AXX17_AT4G00440 [Arabidopsis thaliana]|uniref:Transmembrane protein n=1 Tax=Arabidopsis thaliana TaxID=3702 RepID=A0A178UTS1_ARATH|nr:hypothetical protein AXX17_AT4G00440 [Arabidopsis thaliana]
MISRERKRALLCRNSKPSVASIYSSPENHDIIKISGEISCYLRYCSHRLFIPSFSVFVYFLFFGLFGFFNFRVRVLFSVV